MRTVEIATRQGIAPPVARIDEEELARFEESLHGVLLRPDDPGYEQARSIWNAMVDRRPALIARCTSAEDVQTAVRFARRHGVLVSIRGGGHNIAGNAVCDGGLMIDLSPMTTVSVDPDTRIAKVQPGATLADFDRTAQTVGLATPLGINSTTGVAGLTLGGGFGWLTRRYGMTVDNLIGADVVTADGELVHASLEDNADLFWALRGGGGNFGVVTEFEFRLHPVGPEVLAGLIVMPLEQGRQALRAYRDFATTLDDDTAVWAVLRLAPPLPFLPPEVHGSPVLVFAAFHNGDPDEGRRAIEPVRSFGTVLGEHLGVQPYTSWQQAFDPLLTPGARNYWKSHNFTTFSDGAIDVLIEFAEAVPSPHCEIFLGMVGGEMARVPADATAYPHRDAGFVVNVHGRWETEAEDEIGIAWARDFFEAAAPHATGGAYVNFMTEEEADRVQAAYGPNYRRLVAIKRRYDPDNVFCMNQNIRP